MEFRVLGPLEVRDGEHVVPLGGVRRRAVVARLVLDANRVVSAEGLIAAVWGDEPPASAHAALHNHLSRLRAVLGSRLETRSGGYALRVEANECDFDRFRALAEAATGAAPQARAALLRDALALWRGPPVEDLAGEPVASSAAHLEELYFNALEDRIDADLELGRHDAVVPELEALVEEQPFRERLREQLVLALYRAGRQAEALSAYAEARRTFVEELGVEPGAALQELHHAVLRHDVSLAPAAPSGLRAAPAAEPRESRRLVTVLLADLGVDEDVATDVEARREADRARFDAVRRSVERSGGTVERLGADRLLGVFGVPVAHDDDALRAVTAAFEIAPLVPGARTVVTTGVVIAGGRVAGEPLVAGPPVDDAERLGAGVPAGGVVADERTWRLVRHAVVGRRSDGGRVLERLDPDAPGLLRRLETPLVGREHELEEIVRAFERAAAEQRARLVTILGPPGIGKTRLALEAHARLGGRATCVVGHCRAYGENGTYAPLADVALALGGDDVRGWAAAVMGDDADAATIVARVAAAVGAAEDHGPLEEIAWAARRLLETLAGTRPLVFVVEDAQWGETAFLDLVDHVTDLACAPILILATARSELLERRPGWGGGTASRSSLVLEPLSEAEAELLLKRLAPGAALDREARYGVLARAEGNPLFLEQLVAAAVEGERDLLPDSIQSLLAARLDRLSAAERDALEAAAVAGNRVSTDALAELLGRNPVSALTALVRRELLRSDAEETWAFRHALIRSAAYGAIPKRRRAALHEAFAHSVERRRPPGVADRDQLIGGHLAEAVRCRRELGESASSVRRLADEAGRHLRVAALRAYERNDPVAAAALLGTAAELFPSHSRARAELLLKRALSLAAAGDRVEDWRAADEARAIARRLGDKHLAALCIVVGHNLELSTEKPIDFVAARRDVEAAIPALERAGDDAGLAQAHMVRFHTLEAAPRPARWKSERERALAAAVEHARRSGSSQAALEPLVWECMDLRHGRVPVDEAVRRAEALRNAATTRHLLACALTTLAILRSMQGSHHQARARVQEARNIFHNLGLRWAEARQRIARAEVELMAGDLAAAERLLRKAFEQSTEFEDRNARANAAWRLAIVLARLGSDEEATQFAGRAAELEASGGFWTEVWWRLAAASIDARRGNCAVAEALVNEARELMSELPDSGMHADTLIEAATALRLCGHPDEARRLLEHAVATAERLGYLVALRRARELLVAPAA